MSDNIGVLGNEISDHDLFMFQVQNGAVVSHHLDLKELDQKLRVVDNLDNGDITGDPHRFTFDMLRLLVAVESKDQEYKPVYIGRIPPNAQPKDGVTEFAMMSLDEKRIFLIREQFEPDRNGQAFIDPLGRVTEVASNTNFPGLVMVNKIQTDGGQTVFLEKSNLPY